MNFGKKLEHIGFEKTEVRNGSGNNFDYYEQHGLLIVYRVDETRWSLDNTGSRIDGDQEDFKCIKRIIKNMEWL